MWRTFFRSIALSIIVVSLGNLFYSDGGWKLLYFGEFVEVLSNVLILLHSTDEMEWHTVPEFTSNIANVIIYSLLISLAIKIAQIAKENKFR